MAGVAPPPAYTIQQPQPMMQPSVVLGTINPPPTDALQKRERRWSKALKVTGWLQVSIGIVTVLFGIVAIIIRAWFSYYATPIWMGLLFFVTTGILGVLASSRRKKNLIVGYMVMCILTACAAFVLVLVCIVTASSEDDEIGYWYYSWNYDHRHACNPGGYDDIVYDCAHQAGRQALDVLMLIGAVLEVTVAVVGATYCCYATSCCTCCTCCTQTPTTTAYYTTTGHVTYPSGHPSGQVCVQVSHATHVVPQGPGNPMYIAQPPPPTGYGQVSLTGYPQAQGPVPQPYDVNMPQEPTGMTGPPPNVKYAPASGPMHEHTEMPPMYQGEPPAPPDGMK